MKDNSNVNKKNDTSFVNKISETSLGLGNVDESIKTKKKYFIRFLEKINVQFIKIYNKIFKNKKNEIYNLNIKLTNIYNNLLFHYFILIFSGFHILIFGLKILSFSLLIL